MSYNEKDMGLLPIMSPLYNLREICKQIALLEDHLNQPRKRCPDCIRKHFLTIEALFEEAISLDKEFKYGEHLDGKAQDIRNLQGAWLDTKDTDSAHQAYLLIAQTLRNLRKGFAPICFDVRKMASIVRKASSHICPHMRTATKTQAEKEDEATEKLIRKAPKKKPPRKDLRKNRVEMSDDPDLQGVGRGDSGDQDLSRRSQKMASRIALKYLNRQR
jgi:hypothetical protein